MSMKQLLIKGLEDKLILQQRNYRRCFKYDVHKMRRNDEHNT